MSYEGFSQFLCKNNHYWTKDCYSVLVQERCPICDEFHVWENMVDTTNGSFDDDGNRIDGYVEFYPIDKVGKKEENKNFLWLAIMLWFICLWGSFYLANILEISFFDFSQSHWYDLPYMLSITIIIFILSIYIFVILEENGVEKNGK